MKFYLYVILGSLIIFLSSCISPNSLQSGRTVGKGKADISFCLTDGKYMDDFPDEENRFNYLPIFEAGAKFGIFENFDVSLKFNSSFFVAAQIKLQFLGNKKSLFAASIGADAGIILIPEGTSIWHESIPLYLSIHPTDKFAIYVTPRYCRSNRLVEDTQQGYGYVTGGYWNYADLSYGVIFGKEERLILEISHSGRNSMKPTQFTVGCAFELDKSDVIQPFEGRRDYRRQRPKHK